MGNARQHEECRQYGHRLTSRKENSILVDVDRIDDCVVSRKVVNECAIRARPLLDVVAARRATGERVFGRMDRQRPHRLVVMRQRRHRLASGQVPKSAE